MRYLIIDMHAHVFAKEALARLDRKHKQYASQLHQRDGKTFITTGDKPSSPMEPMPGFSDAEERIKIMDEMGVDAQVLSVTPGNFCYEAPPEAGAVIAAAQNDAISMMVEEHKGRFIGCCTVPLQDPEAAVKELNRCVRDLGFTSVEIGTNIAGKNLDAPELEPFYAEAERLRAPIIVHPINNAGSDRMTRYYLGNIVGNPMETTLSIGSVIFGGVLDRHRELKFCWSHGGGFWPYQMGRFDHGFDVRSEPKTNISKHPSEYASRMYYDTITHSEAALSYLISLMGADNVLYGTDFPWDMGEYDSLPSIQGLSIEPSEREKILGATSARLFKA